MKQTQENHGLSEQNLSVLGSHPLFAGLDPDEFIRQLGAMKAEKAKEK